MTITTKKNNDNTGIWPWEELHCRVIENLESTDSEYRYKAVYLKLDLYLQLAMVYSISTYLLR